MNIFSHGPKALEGRDRIRFALLKHCRDTKQAEQERMECHKLMHGGIELLRQIQDVRFSGSQEDSGLK